MTSVMSPNSVTSNIVPRSISVDSGFEDGSDFDQLKELSDKLKLSTRRPSVVKWKQVIEHRKSHGLYLSSVSTPHINQVRSGVLHRAKSSKSAYEMTYCSPEMTSDEPHRLLFRDNRSLPFDVTSQSPWSTDGVTPTPTRRCRKVAKMIMELDESDVTHADAHQTKTSRSSNKPDDVTKDTDNIAFRCTRVCQMLEQLRHDLIVMRIEDNKLARKLLDVRSELTVVRAQQSCLEHAEMLDDVAYELEEEEEVTGLIKACDLSNKKPDTVMSAFSPLRHMGVSRMNLNRRRFSIR